MSQRIPSPCVYRKRIPFCAYGDNGRCVGCFRAPHQIYDWDSYTPEQKRDIWREIIEMGYEPTEDINEFLE